PTGSVDPNFGRRVRNRRQLNSLQNTWPYGYSMPIAVRYTQDAFSRSGWLWPVDAKGEPLKATSYMAVGFYVAKYVKDRKSGSAGMPRPSCTPSSMHTYTLSLHDALPICRVRNRRQLNSLQNTWPYGYSMPIAVRYTQDAFSRSGWLWPVDAKGEPLKATSYMAVGFYVAKYVNKKSDMDLAAKGL